MKKDIIEDFSLPKYIKGKSFAEASKAINKRFEGRTGTEVERTKEEMLSRLANAQEHIKMKEGLNQPTQNQMAEGGFQTGNIGSAIGGLGDMFQLGVENLGPTGIDTSGQSMQRMGRENVGVGAAGSALKGAAAGAAMGSIVPGIGTAIGAGVGLVGGAITGAIGGSKANKDIIEGNKSVTYRENNANRNTFALGGTVGTGGGDDEKKVNTQEINEATGVQFNDATANSLFARTSPQANPSQTGLNFGKYKDYFVDGNMDGDTMTFTNTKKNPHNASTMRQLMDYVREQNPDRDIKFNYTNQFDGGGWLKNLFTKPKNVIDKEGIAATFAKGSDIYNVDNIDASTNGATQVEAKQSDAVNFKSPVGKAISKTGNWMGDNYGNILRTAPIVANALQLKNLKKPSNIRLDRMDTKYNPREIDERALQNRVINETNNLKGALSNTANGSVGALRSNLLAASLGKTKALGDAYLKADEINRQESRYGQQFDQRTDMMNMRQGTVEQDMNDRNRGAYNSAKSALQSQLATDIGNFGREKTNMKQVAEMFGYKWDGKYVIDDKGNKILPQKFVSIVKGKQDKNGNS